MWITIHIPMTYKSIQFTFYKDIWVINTYWYIKYTTNLSQNDVWLVNIHSLSGTKLKQKLNTDCYLIPIVSIHCIPAICSGYYLQCRVIYQWIYLYVPVFQPIKLPHTKSLINHITSFIIWGRASQKIAREDINTNCVQG